MAGSGDKQASAKLCRLEIDEVAVTFGPPAGGEVITEVAHCPLLGVRGALPEAAKAGLLPICEFPPSAAGRGLRLPAAAGDLGKRLTSTGRTSTWGGLDRRPGVPARDYTGAMRLPEARP